MIATHHEQSTVLEGYDAPANFPPLPGDGVREFGRSPQIARKPNRAARSRHTPCFRSTRRREGATRRPAVQRVRFSRDLGWSGLKAETHRLVRISPIAYALAAKNRPLYRYLWLHFITAAVLAGTCPVAIWFHSTSELLFSIVAFLWVASDVAVLLERIYEEAWPLPSIPMFNDGFLIRATVNVLDHRAPKKRQADNATVLRAANTASCLANGIMPD